ncbi:12932_t:CDS:2 [Cetraspora pellucida]|uniref:12932_t:CDS:1 n=1 Tax=Cetraspora pellucida TaxID=1433469 RepID=A0A9N8Z481_9GLOM|nr:12932_t:CDS:2 [Cetraspora pellucida]
MNAGGKALATALYKNSTLTHLYISSNHLDSEVGKTLASVLYVNTTLTHLSLWNNQLGSEGGRALAEALSGYEIEFSKLSSFWQPNKDTYLLKIKLSVLS